jgi:hypothetical protein
MKVNPGKTNLLKKTHRSLISIKSDDGKAVKSARIGAI